MNVNHVSKSVTMFIVQATEKVTPLIIFILLALAVSSLMKAENNFVILSLLKLEATVL
jgi:hypothetical protein